MSKARGVLELGVPAESARASSRRAFASMGWAVTGERAGVIEAREDPARLPCHHSPASASLRFTGDGGACSVTIETTVPGFGPVSASHARGRQGAIVRRLHAAANDPRT